jgi:phage-related minor tail protein
LRKLLILIPLLSLGGCISTATSIVTAPVRVVSKGVDWTTTSRDEADRNRGRAVRKQEKRDEEARRKAEKERQRQAREN